MMDWHKECLKNQKATYKRSKEYIDSLQETLDRNLREVALYEAQIKLAEKERKDGFIQNDG